MGKQKGCCGCSTIGCGGILVVIGVIVFFAWRFISPYVLQLKRIAEDPVANKIVTVVFDESKGVEQKQQELQSYLSENGYKLSVTETDILVVKDSYLFRIEGIDMTTMSLKDIENLKITLHKNGKTLVFEGKDLYDIVDNLKEVTSK